MIPLGIFSFSDMTAWTIRLENLETITMEDGLYSPIKGGVLVTWGGVFFKHDRICVSNLRRCIFNWQRFVTKGDSDLMLDQLSFGYQPHYPTTKCWMIQIIRQLCACNWKYSWISVGLVADISIRILCVYCIHLADQIS